MMRTFESQASQRRCSTMNSITSPSVRVGSIPGGFAAGNEMNYGNRRRAETNSARRPNPD
jgi:hypothetical protein